MIGIMVPVHNEEALLPACLEALAVAASDEALCGESVLTVVVLDACTDGSENIARACGVRVVASGARNVGVARALGASVAIAVGARWLAFTDGDSEVPADWLSRQVARQADAVCGIVSVKDWGEHSPGVRERFFQGYEARDGHRHIHGANLGISASAYQKVGGFSPVAVHEDVAIVRSLEAAGASVAWVAAPCVTTNGRVVGRLLGGFAGYLRGLAAPGGAGGAQLAG